MSHPSVAEIRAANASLKDHGFFLRTIRPLGPYCAWVGLRLGLRPIQLNFFNFALALFCCGLLALGPASARVPAAILLLIWQTLDVTDGTMARTLGIRSNYGGFVDHLAGIFLIAFFCISVGLGLYLHPEGSVTAALESANIRFDYDPAYSLILGAYSSVAAILMRLTQRIVQVRFGTDPVTEDVAPDGSIISRGLGLVRDLENIGGYFLIVFFAAVLLGKLEWFILFYFLVYAAMLAGATAQVFRSLRERHDYL
ncbi:MAG: CDP-alcohol phosphatidyltransferase family protein [Candidatus Binatia bacterium]|nr:CDP-alcohol phosphatidyltransferase family protein [Candidatus Binatia bacterium]